MVLFSLFSLYFCTMHACAHCISLYFIPILKSPSRLHSLKTTSAHGIKLHPAFVLLNAIMHCLRARFFPSCAALRSCSLVCVCVCVCVCLHAFIHPLARGLNRSYSMFICILLSNNHFFLALLTDAFHACHPRQCNSRLYLAPKRCNLEHFHRPSSLHCQGRERKARAMVRRSLLAMRVPTIRK